MDISQGAVAKGVLSLPFDWGVQSAANARRGGPRDEVDGQMVILFTSRAAPRGAISLYRVVAIAPGRLRCHHSLPCHDGHVGMQLPGVEVRLVDRAET